MKKKYKLDISSLEKYENEGEISLIPLDDDNVSCESRVINQFKKDNRELIEKNKYNIKHNINENIIVEYNRKYYLLKQYYGEDSPCNKCDFDCRNTCYCPLDLLEETQEYYLEKKELFEIEFEE